MNINTISRRSMLTAGVALGAIGLPALAQSKTVLRISTPAVPDDWHAKMWTVFKDSLEKSAPGEFDVQINLNAALFKQGTEPAAMARGNLELSSISAFDIAKLVPEFSVFTAGYIVRDPEQQQKIFNGPIGAELFKTVSEKMDVTPLATVYLGTRQLNLREVRNVKTPADLKGVKLRMPGSKEWLFLGESLGATATPLAFGEVYLGLKTGTIDGQDNPLPSVRAAKFYEVTKQIVLTNHLVDGIFIAISNKSFRSPQRPRPQQPTTTKTASKKKRNWWSFSRKKACRSPRPIWRPSASRFKPPTRTRITPRSGPKAWLTASTRSTRVTLGHDPLVPKGRQRVWRRSFPGSVHCLYRPDHGAFCVQQTAALDR